MAILETADPEVPDLFISTVTIIIRNLPFREAVSQETPPPVPPHVPGAISEEYKPPVPPHRTSLATPPTEPTPPKRHHHHHHHRNKSGSRSRSRLEIVENGTQHGDYLTNRDEPDFTVGLFYFQKNTKTILCSSRILENRRR